jgi:hypothetical protein
MQIRANVKGLVEYVRPVSLRNFVREALFPENSEEVLKQVEYLDGVLKQERQRSEAFIANYKAERRSK